MIAGQNVFLRPIDKDDTPLVIKWRNDPRIMPNLFGHMPLSRASHEAWFEGYLKSQRDILFIIETREHIPIGTVGLSKIDHRNQSAEFGRMLIGEENFLGQGMAADATMALLRFAFLEMNLNRIFLEVFAFNDDAVEMYCRCGFEIEGTKREGVFTRGRFHDVVIMSVLRHDFVEKFGDR